MKGDIVADGERIEERTLLEDHAGAGAQGEKLLLGHEGDLLAEEQNAALIGTQQAVGEFQQNALAHPGGTEKDARFARRDRETDVVEHRRAVEGLVLSGVGESGGLIHRKRVSSIWVRRKSVKMMSTEAVTTA